MIEETPHGRAEELLLARISEAAGRERLGRRRATHQVAPPKTTRRMAPIRALKRARGRRGTYAGARLDFYEFGMTAAAHGRIHVIRYDTTSVSITGAYALTDVDGEQVVLHGDDFGPPQVWEPEIRRAVTEAQVPQALVALVQGARIDFGPLWLTGGGVGSGRTSTPWTRIQRIDIRDDSVALRVAGRWQVLATAASRIPNVFVLQALVEHLARLHRRGDAEQNDG